MGDVCIGHQARHACVAYTKTRCREERPLGRASTLIALESTVGHCASSERREGEERRAGGRERPGAGMKLGQAVNAPEVHPNTVEEEATAGFILISLLLFFPLGHETRRSRAMRTS